jgi:predicted NBD/HSP70 family sugar kinase
LALARRSGHATAEEALADPGASEVVRDGAQRLGLALAALINALDPGVVIVGGGLGLDASYRGPVVEAMRAAIYDPVRVGCRWWRRRWGRTRPSSGPRSGPSTQGD